jgi:ABC-type oligopeptide transport system substrate-binding subunit
VRDVTDHSALHRRRFLKYSGALAAAGALSSSLAACSSGPQSTNDTGGGKGGKDATLTAVIGYGNDGSWDPTQTASAFAMAANNHIYEGLLDTDPISREPYAALATQVPGDLSGTSWKFTLRAGATFHDGKPVTADDVVFVFDRILDPKTQTLGKGFFASWLKEVRKIDASNVELVLRFPFPEGIARLTLAKIMPKHVFSQPGAWDDAIKGKAVGSGPYRQTAHHPKSNTTFEAFTAYNGPRRPAFKKMNWLTIVDAAPRVAKISGASAGAQIADNIPYANIEQLRKGGMTVEGGAGMNNLFLMFHTKHKPFDDVRVRQALHYAIDTGKMVEVALHGHGRPSSSFLNEGNPAYRPAKTVYGYDPQKAKQLLKAEDRDPVRERQLDRRLPADHQGVLGRDRGRDHALTAGDDGRLHEDGPETGLPGGGRRLEPQPVRPRRRPDHALQLRPREPVDAVRPVGGRPGRETALQGHGPGDAGAGRRQEEDDDPGLHRRRRRTGRALPGRAQRADDGLGSRETHGHQGPALSGRQPPPGQVGLT